MLTQRLGIDVTGIGVMVNVATEQDPYQAAWNKFLLEVRNWTADTERWLETLSTSEKVLGVCLIALAILTIVFLRSKEKPDPGSSGGSFTTVLVLVMMAGFGLGWFVDNGAGSLSYITGR